MIRNAGPPTTEARMIVWPTPSRPEIRLAVNAAEQRPQVADREREPDRQGTQMQLPACEHQQNGEPHRAEEVEERGARSDVLQVGVAQDVAEAFPQLDAHLASRRPILEGGLGLSDPEDEESRGEKADCVDQNRRRGLQQADEDTCEPRPTRLRRGTADLELRVPVDDLVTLDERGKIRLVRDVEEDGCDPDQKADAEQLPDRQCVEEVRDRDRREQTGPRKVAGDQDRSAWQTVDPDAGRQAHEQEWEKFDRGQRSDLESGRVQHVDRGERQRELADLRPELTDGLGRPEL